MYAVADAVGHKSASTSPRPDLHRTQRMRLGRLPQGLAQAPLRSLLLMEVRHP